MEGEETYKSILVVESKTSSDLVTALTNLSNMAVTLEEAGYKTNVTAFPMRVLEDREIDIRLIELPYFGWYSEKISDGTFLEKLTLEDVEDLVGDLEAT